MCASDNKSCWQYNEVCIGLLYSLFMFLLSGCMDDRERNYSIGQQFVTTDNRQCLCGNGGSISCGHTDSESSRSLVKST